MVGRLTSLPMTFLGALLLGLCQELTNVVVAVARRRRLPPGAPRHPRHLPRRSPCCSCRRSASRPAASSAATSRAVPDPAARPSLAGVGSWSSASSCSPTVGPADLQPHLVRALVMATIALSLVAVTGLSGQISLTQYLFLGSARSSPASLRRATACSACSLGGARGRGARRGRRPAVGAPARAAPRAEHVRLRAHRPRGRARRPARLRARRPHPCRPARDPRASRRSSDAAFAVWCAVVFAAARPSSWAWSAAAGSAGSSPPSATASWRRPRSAARPRRTKVAIFAVSAFIAGCAGVALRRHVRHGRRHPVRAGQQPGDRAVRVRRRHHHRLRRRRRRRRCSPCSPTPSRPTRTSPAVVFVASARPPSASAASPTASPAWSCRARPSPGGAAGRRPRLSRADADVPALGGSVA